MDDYLEELHEEYKIKRHQYMVSIRKNNRNQILNTRRKRYSELNPHLDPHPENSNHNAQTHQQPKFTKQADDDHTDEANQKNITSANCHQPPSQPQEIELLSNSQKLYGPKPKLQRQWEEKEKYFRIILDKELEQIINQIMSNPLGSSDLEEAMRLSHMAQDCYSLHKGIINIRKIICQRNEDLYDILMKILDDNLLSVFINLVNQDIFKQLKFESLWILTNMAECNSYFCERIVLRKGIPSIVNILKGGDEYLVDQAIWALGNIVADSGQFKEMVIQQNGIHQIIKLALQTKNKQLFDSCVWAAINICSQCDYEQNKQEINKTSQLVCSALIAGFLHDDTFEQALGMIYKCTEFIFQRIATSGIAPYLIQTYSSKSNLKAKHKSVILKILGKFSQSNLLVIQTLLNHGILELIHGAILDNRQSLVQNALYILSNLLFGNSQQIDLIFQNRQIFAICQLLIEEASEGVQYEASYVFLNLINCSNTLKVIDLCKQIDIINVVNGVIDCSNIALVELALKILFSVLTFGQRSKQEGSNKFVSQVVNSDVLDKLYNLQTHKCKQISRLSISIIEYFFQQYSTVQSVEGLV